jgi:alanine-synthesizing transaminase
VHGTGFNWKQPDHLRMVFLPPVGELAEALEKFADFLQKYRT